MKVRVIAPFEVRGLDKDGSLEVPAGTKVMDILKRTKSIQRYLKVLPMMVNGEQVKATHILKDGDTLVVVYPVSGG